MTTDANGNATFTSIILSVYQYISATATDSLGNTSEFSMVSSAADGIADTWKIKGIDVLGNGTFYTLPDATPMHKDIYVQVDAMDGFAPIPIDPAEEPNIPLDLQTGTDLDYVVAAFYNAPVSDPDGTTGINLHIQIVNTNIPAQVWSDPNSVWTGFSQVEAANFGTAAERANPTALEAKSLVYRYCVFADEVLAPDPSNPGQMTYGRSGFGELDGSGFFVTLGDWADQGELTKLGYPFPFEDFQEARLHARAGSYARAR